MPKANTDGMIDITGADLVTLAKAAYELSSPAEEGQLEHSAAELWVNGQLELNSRGEGFIFGMEYCRGRACKMYVWRYAGRLFIEKHWRDHTEEQLQELLKRIGIATT